MTPVDGPKMRPPDGRRLRIYRVTPEAFLALGQGQPGRTLILDRAPIPADARVHGVGFDDQTGEILIRVESAEFAEVMEGCLIPNADGPWFGVRYGEPEAALPSQAVTDRTVGDAFRAANITPEELNRIVRDRFAAVPADAEAEREAARTARIVMRALEAEPMSRSEPSTPAAPIQFRE